MGGTHMRHVDTTASDGVADSRSSTDWRALGLLFCAVWGCMLIYAAPMGNRSSGTVFDFFTPSMLASILGFAAVSLIARRGGPLGTRRIPLIACGIVSATATAVYLLGGSVIPLWASLVTVAVVSITFAFLLTACHETYVGLAPFQALAWAGASYAIGRLACAVLVLLPEIASCVVTSAMPLAALATMPCWKHTISVKQDTARAGKTSLRDAEGHGTLPEDLRRLFVAIPPRILLGLAMAHVCNGAVTALMGPTSNTPGALSAPCIAAAFVVSAACVGAAFIFKRRVPFITFYKSALVVLAFGTLLLAELPQQASALISAALVGMSVVSWALEAQCARAGLAIGAIPAMVCATGHLMEHLGNCIGSVAIQCELLPSAITIALIAALLLVAVAFLFTGAFDDTAMVPTAKAERGESDIESPGPTIEERVRMVAERYDLSARETEVFALWATGHDVKYVREKLGLSQSTVKTHVQHIYAKTDTHSRAEVVILLDDAKE